VCGICGIAGTRGPVDRDVLARMSASLVHRGPDDEGSHVDGGVGLAARRLSIIDLSHGHQPISSEDGEVTVVQNGELYDHAELREGLRARGHTFATRCDTEVLAHLYEEHGPAFAAEPRGMFAAAVWDARRRRLVLARDRFGIKPLFYAEHDGQLAFASELQALLPVPWVSRELDLESLEAYLAHNVVPGPRSILRGVRKLPPGHVLVWEDGRSRLERFARPAPRAAGDLRGEDPRELAAELRDRLRDSVRAHLVADVPVGVLLSGGVDSSTLAALAAEEGTGTLKTFSIGFEERSFDELGLARQIAERYGAEHHELILRPDAVSLLREVALAFDEPSGDSSALPTYLVSRLAAGHVKVALSGEGGDELFGGYETYAAGLLAERRVMALARRANALVERLPSGSGRVPLDYKLKRFTRVSDLPPLERHHGFKTIFTAEARAGLMRDAPGADPLASWRARFAETADAELLARLQDVDLGTYLVDDLLTKTDRMSMAHSLELRVPFLDPVVAELALALPSALKVRGMAKKRLLRQAAEPLIGRDIARGRKRGFSIPAAAWLRGEALPFAREVLAPDAVREQGVLDPAVVTGLLEAHAAGREDLSRQLWGLMSFGIWYDRLRLQA
jgi:asparagine synthase (glutamine-hydrolysing)